MGVVRTDPQPEQDNRADRPLTGRGWVVGCPRCGKSYFVSAEQVMASPDWLVCPHCASGGKEAA